MVRLTQKNYWDLGSWVTENRDKVAGRDRHAIAEIINKNKVIDKPLNYKHVQNLAEILEVEWLQSKQMNGANAVSPLDLEIALEQARDVVKTLEAAIGIEK